MNKQYNLDEILKKLKSKAKPENLIGMAKFAIGGDKRLGVAVPDMRRLAKEIGKDQKLSLELWKTGIPEAMIVASMIGVPLEVTEKQADAWVKDIAFWDLCDQTAMNLFEKLPFVSKKIVEWSKSDIEFTKRMSYALIACLAWHDKNASDEFFIKLFPIIKSGATDERNFVKKAVNWALRNIGKRNINLNKEAINLAKEIQKIDSKAAKWVASDTIRELDSKTIQNRLQK
ncbi:DNA alkylation repair protein [candidate division CPR3 bacterium GWF2_35_18]|uniref:DNA alkylation repair protein n=1 Tax=candidate division CPR3 bacterium GW2011_GWF2_35_18 TaxID=1618350 RepID=A0A0G0E2S3_UNCC3|nr:MAG: hypothetical protein UR67_C0005G0019 [candidate division CPR3 bacterium GW2011_GWF2_35_18]KKP85354.1 MAG: hypothetical protein UR87_C0054G0003 [candidate division CPR3 bacterium GW2011_GWE2_35_7]OGB62999.1 MAG: DNA alkylation repair protein [candidate division CPR3 bacterium GWF2_35_18]OGB63977.1 MAG: DNA alkylation repair protein [candidate division CPR3 bacterium RIFOXYA2_FULL_35_13]OGB78429.1 MAG: DNA alkylation repair protein [candidate division CPR3 bacterium RIFOXYB2_FULL_35_8]OG